MVDNMNPDPTPSTEPAVAETKQGFFSSTLGKVLLVVGGLSVVLGLLAVVGMFVLGNGLFNAAKADLEAGAVTAGSTSTSATAESEPAEKREAEPIADVFSFRNPFVPTVKPALQETETATSGSSGSSGGSSGNSSGSSDGGSDSAESSVPKDTLALKSIKTEDGKLVATFIWNGNTYTAGEGDQLGDTAWKVVNLTSNTATMLYGDSEVTLSVGQGISK